MVAAIKRENIMKRVHIKISAVAGFSLLFFSCSNWFEAKIPIDTETESANLSQLLTPKKKITSLEPPKQVFASKGLYKDKILVSWKEVPNAASYRVERAVVKSKNADGTWSLPDESDFIAVKTYTAYTVFEDNILSNAGSSNEEYEYRYYYRISAENIGKRYDSSDFTDYKKDATEGCGWLFAPVVQLAADKGKSQDFINLKWEYNGNARGYRIYRDTRSDFSTCAEIDRVIGNNKSYTQTVEKKDQGVEFYYKVCAENVDGKLSAMSSIAMGYALKEGAPPAPSGVTVENGLGTSKSEINVKWNEIAPASGITITYSVYRTCSEDSVFTCVKRNIPSNSPDYKDTTSLKTGIYYYYYIQAIAKKTLTEEILKSSFSESGAESASPAVGFLLSPPVSLEIADPSDGNSDNADIIWQPAIGSVSPYNIKFTYNIYYSDTEDGTYTVIPGLSGITGTLSDGRLSCTAAKKNFYKVSTVNTAGVDQESIMSMTAAPVPDAPTNVAATKTEKLSKDFIANDYGVYPVKITWKAAPSSSPAGYNIFRSNKPDSSFRKLNEHPIAATEFIDKNESAKAGTYYYYKVISLNSLGQGKKSNDPSNDLKKDSWGYGALTREQWFREFNKSIKRSQAKLILMHKPGNTDKLGKESKNGDVQGSVSYNARVSGLGAEVTIEYSNYADFYAFDGDAFKEFNAKYFGTESNYPRSFILNGNTDTSANMSSNGNMHGTVKCTGMYPGEVVYNHIDIKGGAAGGGYYIVQTKNTKGEIILANENVNWKVGEE